MRGYFWGNMYLSSIQQGIQSAHCVGEMFVKYNPVAVYGAEFSFDTGDIELDEDPSRYNMLSNWAVSHKTMILLNGGYSSTLRNLLKMFTDEKNPYPFAHFNEGDDALDGALTCVGIILPEKIYCAAAISRKDSSVLDTINDTGNLPVPARFTESGEDERWTYNSWEAKLVAELNNYGLAS